MGHFVNAAAGVHAPAVCILGRVAFTLFESRSEQSCLRDGRWRLPRQCPTQCCWLPSTIRTQFRHRRRPPEVPRQLLASSMASSLAVGPLHSCSRVGNGGGHGAGLGRHSLFHCRCCGNRPSAASPWNQAKWFTDAADLPKLANRPQTTLAAHGLATSTLLNLLVLPQRRRRALESRFPFPAFDGKQVVAGARRAPRSYAQVASSAKSIPRNACRSR